MSSSARADFAALIETDWANIADLEEVRVVATERKLDTIAQSTAIVRQRAIAREPVAPQSMRRYGFILTIASAYADFDKAADELDVLVGAALDYLDTRYEHGDATAVLYVDRLAYDIPVTVTATKE